MREAASTHRFLHLATHGYFAPPSIRSALGPSAPAARLRTDFFGAQGIAGYNPGLLSGLALTGANVRPTPTGKDDGILTAFEVAELDLAKVDLAVLSACETGLGEVAGGEGLLGLQRAFQVAGARAVVASLWSVKDKPTRALMAKLYENLWRNGLTPCAAIREAQLNDPRRVTHQAPRRATGAASAGSSRTRTTLCSRTVRRRSTGRRSCSAPTDFNSRTDCRLNGVTWRKLSATATTREKRQEDTGTQNYRAQRLYSTLGTKRWSSAFHPAQRT